MEGFLIQDASYTRLKRQADSAGRQGIYLAEYAENAERKMPFQDGRAKQFILFNAHWNLMACGYKYTDYPQPGLIACGYPFMFE